MRRRRRVLFATHGTDRGGGAEQGLVEMVAALEYSDIEPVVILPGSGGLSEEVDGVGVRWRTAPSARWTPFDVTTFDRRLWRPRLALAIARQLPAWVSLLRDEVPDAVVTNTAVTPVPALACRLLGIPHIWWVREFVTLDHGLQYAFGEQFSQRVIGWTSSAVMVNSNAVRDHYSPPIKREKVVVVYDGVPRREVGPIDPEGGVRLLLLGRQNEGKGSSLALRAFGRLARDVPATLRLTGEIAPAYLDELRALADELGVADRLEIFDYHAKADEHLDWCNVLLMTSAAEAFGRVTVEALTAGRPVIGSRSGGTPELIADGVDGILFTPGDAGGLAAAITRLATEPGLLAKMSDEALTRTGGHYSLEEQTEQFGAVLDRVLGGH